MDVRNKTVELDVKALKTAGNDGASLGDGIAAEFVCVVTTNKEDRDHDILEPAGAVLDTKMPLLWQHDATQPIGKYVQTVERDSEKVVAKFQVADTPLGRDAVALMKLGVLRISHGFRPLDYEQRKGTSGGFHFKRYEIVEVSAVSIPSNSDAEIVSLSTKSFESQPVKDWWAEILKKGNQMSTLTTPPADTKTGTFTIDEITAAFEKAITGAITKANGNGSSDGAGGTGEKRLSPAELLLRAAGSGTGDVRVKSVADRYSSESRTLLHKSGETMRHTDGSQPQSMSQLQAAKSMAFIKLLAKRAGLPVSLREEEKSAIELCFADKWVGDYDGKYHDEIDGTRMKALLDDSVSGGSNAVPFWWDNNVVQFPLLYGELYPFCDIVPVPRGSSVHTASVANPQVLWGAEGSDISLYDTAAFVAAVNTTIFPVAVAVEVGRDELADSPADLGRIITENIGMRMQAEYDKVIAIGNGTSQPTGIFTASGTNSFNADNTTSGPPTVNDYVSMLFTTQKQYRVPAMRPCFLSGDVSYQRSRAVHVAQKTSFYSGAAATSVNQLPVFSPLNDVANYQTLGHPHRISQAIGNSDIAFACMARYRLYRRSGMEVRIISEGAELARRNTVLIIVRSRIGGQPVDPAAFTVCTDAQS